jgi:ATP-citrate lyase alpha-subunit
MKSQKPDYLLFDRKTEAIIFGYQVNAIQRMLDFDYICRRDTPSVAAIVAPTLSNGLHKCFFGNKEILIPIYKHFEEAIAKHQGADVMVNFSSYRSAYPTTMHALASDTICTVVIIAEGVPERYAREMAAFAKQKSKWIIGPATVGAICAGAFKTGNAAGTLENIIRCKLYRPGSVGFVSTSGGLFNELNNIISQATNGVYEGIAIGGDLYPGSTFIDHCLRFEANPNIKMIVILGELGGRDEYDVVEAIKVAKLTKPVVAWCIGTCARLFPGEVQFGHAGARARDDLETAEAKNHALREVGAIVPKSFDELRRIIRETFKNLKEQGQITEILEQEVPPVPEDFSKALVKGFVRRPTNFICTVSDERGEDVLYGGIPLTQVIEKNYSLGDVIGLLWLKCRLPKWASDFIEMCLKIVADHGPCVSGAHNAIVTARAGKDLVSSLVSGLLSIGPRFGGAIDGAAYYFRKFFNESKTPRQMVDEMKAAGILIPGIGHRIKSVRNPDKRVELLKKYAKTYFPETKYLNYALEVEGFTTAKRGNLILNVDGCIGVLFVDMLNSCGFSPEEINEIIGAGTLNAIFILGRSIGIISHILDQKRLKTGLYRHPWDDVLFAVNPPKEVGQIEEYEQYIEKAKKKGGRL